MTTAHIDPDDPRNLWVSPDADGGGLGTRENPFAAIAPALKRATPGRRVVLLPGVYRGDLTVDVSGGEDAPVYIAAYETGEAVIDGGRWYFYDTSDLVVSGMTFRNARRGAVSAVGECLRNRFHAISFLDCGAAGEASCTFYFGGAGARFNIVEDCVFSRAAGCAAYAPSAGNAAVGLMVSGGGDGGRLTNHIFRRNRFSGYDESIIVGASRTPDSESGHIVEFNEIGNARKGIAVNCGDVRIRGNVISGCASAGIDLSSGDVSTVEGNRISGCGCGISVRGTGHTVAGNRIVGCKSAAVIAKAAGTGAAPAVNLYAYENHFVDCGTGAVVAETGTSGVIQNNRFYGQTPACVFPPESKDRLNGCTPPANKNFVITENAEGLCVEEYVDDGADIRVDGYDDSLDDGYMEASIPDVACGVDGGDVYEQEEIINFMFGREDWEK